MSRTCLHPNKTSRQASAIELAKERAMRSPQQQLVLLNSRPGNSARERARLNRQIASLKPSSD